MLPLGVVVAVDDEKGAPWFAKEAEEPRGLRFGAGWVENGDGGDVAVGDGGAALVDPVEVDPQEEAEERRGDDNGRL